MGKRILLVLLALAAVTGFAIALARSQRLPEGPQPISWDREACAECRMHVGDPRFAAQLQTTGGEVLSFDDPGCLLAYEAAHHPVVHAVYFHHLREDRWIAREKVAFVTVPESPMAHGLGAVDAGTPASITYADAAARIGKEHR